MSRPCSVQMLGTAAAIAGLIACAAGQEPTSCDAPPRIAVTAGRQPTFTWEPTCGAAEIAINDVVAPGDSAPTRWWVRVRDGRNTIESGVGYGVRPGGTEVVVAPASLAAGQGYRVTLLWYTDAGNGMQEVHASSAVFTP